MISKLISYCYLILFFLTPLIFTPSTSELFEFPKILFVYSLTVIIVGLHLINVISGNSRLIKASFLNIPILLFLLSQIIATYFSIDRHTSIFGYYSRFNGGLLSTISYISLYFVILSYIDQKFVQKIINVSLFSGFFVAVYGIAQHFGIDKNYWVQDVQSRVFSTLGQPNWLAAYLCLLLPFSIASIIANYSNKKYLLLTLNFGLSTIFFLCLLFTKSKTGLLAACLTLCLFFILYLYKNFHQKSSVILLTFTFSLFALLSITINNPIKDIVFKSSIPDTRYQIPDTINITPSEDIRKLVWSGAIDLWKKFPYFGTGTETFAFSYYWTRPAAHNLTSEWDFIYNKAHNEYLNYLATTGTFGFITYILIILIVLLNLFWQLNKKDYLLPLAILSSFITLLVTNATGFSVVITSLYFFLLPSLLTNPSVPINTKPTNKAALVIIGIIIIFLLSKIYTYLKADLNYNIASSYNDQAYYSDALTKINQSVDNFPDEPIYLMKIADIAAKNALIANQQKEPDKVKDYIDISIRNSTLALSISPANINFYKEQAQMYYYLSTIDSSYFSKAITAITISTQLAPTDAKSYYILGKFWSAVDKNPSAILAYQKALDLKSNYDHASFALGELYYNQKDYSQAKIYFDQTLKLAPNNTDAQKYLKKIP